MPVSWSSTRLILHGLWPAYASKRKNGTSPLDCQKLKGKIDLSVPPLALDFAPNYHKGLAKHEYEKHGSCTNLPPKVYFEEGMRTMLMIPRTDRGTPELIKANIGREISSKDLRACYQKAVGIKVSEKCALEEITTCWSKENKSGLEKVGKPIDCPDYILNGFRNNCDSKKCKGRIFITKLGSCQA